MTKEKYALLDTDFISKTHLIRKDDQNKMIDRVMELPEYRFYCHEQIRTELARHDIGDSPEWVVGGVSKIFSEIPGFIYKNTEFFQYFPTLSSL